MEAKDRVKWYWKAWKRKNKVLIMFRDEFRREMLVLATLLTLLFLVYLGVYFLIG